MSRRSNLAYQYDPEPEPVHSGALIAKVMATPAPDSDMLAMPDGNAARGMMIAALAGIGAWGAIGAGVLSVWRLMA